MNEETSKEAIQLAVKMIGEPSLKLFMKGLEIFVGKPVKAGLDKTGNAIKEAIHPTHGQMAVSTLIRKDQGVTSIPLENNSLKDFRRIARQYGVDFAVVRDRNVNPPVTTVFFKARDTDAINQILSDYANQQLKGQDKRVSLKEKLDKYKAIVAKNPKRVVEKIKEAVR